MSVLSGIIDYLADEISRRISDTRVSVTRSVDYREGRQPAQLRVKAGQADDNLTVNFCGLIVDRGVSAMLGGGVEFDLPGEGETPEEQYISAVMDANKQQILLYRAAVTAADSGTGYLKILPDGVIGRDERKYPRLVVLNPAHVTMDTLPDDIEQVIRYVIQYTIEGPDGKPLSKRQVHEHTPEGNTWMTTNYEWSGGRWEKVGEGEEWPFDFPAILHWQNLPNPYSVYGEPDLTDDVRELQDRTNYLASNLSKIIRYYAHPMRYGRNLGNKAMIQVGPDDLPNYNDPTAAIEQLPQLGDLAGSMEYMRFVRQALFDITRTVDLDSIQDKLGSLTNFGLRVLYTDALGKIGTKRALFGDALLELVRRLLVLNGMNADPGQLEWPDPLPVNEREQIEAVTADLGNGIMSKETAAQKRGLDWEAEQERLAGEKQGETSIGEELLRAFDRGTVNA